MKKNHKKKEPVKIQLPRTPLLPYITKKNISTSGMVYYSKIVNNFTPKKTFFTEILETKQFLDSYYYINGKSLV